MAKYRSNTIEKKEIWEQYVLSQNPKSFLHSWNWGETNKLLGHKIFRLGFYSDKKLVGVCLAIKEKARRGPYLVVPGGPLIDWNKKQLSAFVTKTLKDLAEQEKVWFVRMRPELIDTRENRTLIQQLGFHWAPMHLHAENTWILNINRSEEEMLQSMRKTTRYLIRQSLKAGLSVEKYSSSEMAPLLTQVQGETIKRHKFVGFSEKLFSAQLETFGQDKQASLFVCKLGSEVLAAAIIIFYGDCAYYHHSGSVSRYQKIPFSYFLQWNIIKAAQAKGCKFYNFWGIAPTDDPKHRFAGVTTFKKGFGGERVDWLHAQDLPVSNAYWLTYLFEFARKRIRRL